MKKIINKKNQVKIDTAAEQLARLFIEQAKWMHTKVKNNTYKVIKNDYQE